MKGQIIIVIIKGSGYTRRRIHTGAIGTGSDASKRFAAECESKAGLWFVSLWANRITRNLVGNRFRDKGKSIRTDSILQIENLALVEAYMGDLRKAVRPHGSVEPIHSGRRKL